jgi:cytochrome b561
VTPGWAAPRRWVHWGLAGAAAAGFVTGSPVDAGRVHGAVGALAVALLVGRGLWAAVGPLRSRAPVATPHSRTARVSAWVAWSGVAALGVTGAVVTWGEEGRGLLAGVVTPSAGVAAHTAHRWLAWAGVAWLGVHLAGVARHRWVYGEDLLRRLLTGVGAPDRRAEAALLVAAAGAVAVAVASAPAATRVGPPVAEVWARECGDCHLAYPPSLLPGAAWERLLAEDADHFGESLALPPDVAAELRAVAAAGAAERAQNEFAARVAGEDVADGQITRTRAWADAHAEVPAGSFGPDGSGSPGRCGACHPGAESGGFDARETRAAADAARRSS